MRLDEVQRGQRMIFILGLHDMVFIGLEPMRNNAGDDGIFTVSISLGIMMEQDKHIVSYSQIPKLFSLSSTLGCR
jgi:hypothetical protein